MSDDARVLGARGYVFEEIEKSAADCGVSVSIAEIWRAWDLCRRVCNGADVSEGMAPAKSEQSRLAKDVCVGPCEPRALMVSRVKDCSC